MIEEELEKTGKELDFLGKTMFLMAVFWGIMLIVSVAINYTQESSATYIALSLVYIIATLLFFGTCGYIVYGIVQIRRDRW